jgi:hypothetical protein
MSPQQLADRAESKAMTAEIEPVESENPNGEFRLVLSTDRKDRDGDNVWADQWRLPLPDRIHFDTDHAWARGMSVPLTAGSAVPSIDADGKMVVSGEYAATDHAQLTRSLVNGKHVRHASVSYLEHEMPDGTIERELLNGTFCGVPANPDAVILESKSYAPEIVEKAVEAQAQSKKSGGTTEGQYPADEGPFADPENRKWPLNTRKRILNAWARIHQSDATKNYNESEIATMTGRIRSAARREGIELSDDNSKELVASLAAVCKALAHNGKLHTKDLPDFLQTQSTPGNTPIGEDVGASSVYDDDDDDSDDDGSDADELGGDDLMSDSGTLAQALHDAACALGAACMASLKAGKAESKTPALTVPLRVVTAGPPGQEMYSIYAEGHDEPIAYGSVKDLQLNNLVVSKTGAPVGPYQGVEGMSGENASGTEPGQPLADGQLFQEGTAGAAIAPQFLSKSATNNDDSSDEQAPSAAEAETASAAASNKDAAADAVNASPADVAAKFPKADARLRLLKLQNKNLQTLGESIAEQENDSDG